MRKGDRRVSPHPRVCLVRRRRHRTLRPEKNAKRGLNVMNVSMQSTQFFEIFSDGVRLRPPLGLLSCRFSYVEVDDRVVTSRVPREGALETVVAPTETGVWPTLFSKIEEVKTVKVRSN